LSAGLIEQEHAVRLAMPARQEITAGNWVIRISGGKTKRINSVNAVAQVDTLEGVLDAAERTYAAHGLPSRFRLTPLVAGAIDARLADSGYIVVDEAITMTVTLPPPLDAGGVLVEPTASPAWLAAVADARDWPKAQRMVHPAILASLLHAGFATLTEGGRPLAFGVASIARGQACLFDIVVVADARGRGLGRQVMEALLGWAHREGCASAALQVLAANEPARRLYAGLGFVDAFAYHYRVKR
jgi:N-acetylglutamate synthase